MFFTPASLIAGTMAALADQIGKGPRVFYITGGPPPMPEAPMPVATSYRPAQRVEYFPETIISNPLATLAVASLLFD